MQKVNNKVRKIRQEEFLLVYLHLGVWKRLFAGVKMVKKYVS